MIRLKRALSSQIGHDLPRDLLIAGVVIAANDYLSQGTVLVRLCYFSSILRKGF
jgi:hypothetical protein